MAGGLDGDWVPPGRQLPHSVEAEKAVLGAILIDNRAYARCAGLLPEHFAIAEHRETYRLISSLIDEGKLADPVTIRSQLNGCVPGDKTQFLLGLADSGVTPINAGEYARLLRDLATRRSVIEACDEAISGAYSGDMGADPSVVVAGLQERISGLVSGSCEGCMPEKASELPDVDDMLGERIMGEWLCGQNAIMIHADKSVGKSMFATSLGLAIASGADFLGWKGSDPRRVVYVDGEMSLKDHKSRLRSLSRGRIPDLFYSLHHERANGGMGFRPLNSPEGRMDIASGLLPGDVLILDNLLTLWSMSRGQAWNTETIDWQPVQSWIIELRRKGISTIVLHHDGKSGDQLGSHSKLVIFNAVIQLKRPSDAPKSSGCKFEATFRYSRTARGDDVRPIAAELRDGPEGAEWLWSPLSESKEADVMCMHEMGMTPKDIAVELGIGLATVYRKLNDNGVNTSQKTRRNREKTSRFS